MVLIPPVEFVIPNYNFSVLKAQDKEWLSPPFYIHNGGYMMCIRVRPNGWERGKGLHVYISFVLYTQCEMLIPIACNVVLSFLSCCNP